MQAALQQAFRLYQRGDKPQAEQLCRRIEAQHPGQPEATNLLGILAIDRGEIDEARRWFRKGLKKSPQHKHLLNSMGLAEKQRGALGSAESYFQRSLKADAGFFQAAYNLAHLYELQHRFERAETLYRSVLERQPGHADAAANLALLLEQRHEVDEARSLATRALQSNPAHYIARLALANIATRRHAHDEVIERLLPLVESQTLSPVNHAVAAGKCAYAFEKKGEYNRAFGLYRAANEVLRSFYAPRFEHMQSLYAPAAVSRIADAIPQFDFARGAGHDAAPVFLVGFPRSGTTLLDQVLSSHSRIAVIEESENLIDAYTRFPPSEKGLRELETARPAQLEALRRKYRKRVAQALGGDAARPVVVDKLPLNAVALLHIARLFPGARIVVALRDPRDCVLSCYQQRFGMNQAMFQLLRLDTAAAYYDLVMTVVARMHDAGAIPMHFVRYERVIEDFDAEIGAVVEYLGLEWEDALRDYQATAKSRHISTPSASQVIQPLYATSIGKWKHYRPWIDPYLPPLQGWVEHWGYAPAAS